MGKSLIIKGADFSAVAIDSLSVSVLGLATWFIGQAWQMNSAAYPQKDGLPDKLSNPSNARFSTNDFTDISSVTSDFSQLVITPKTGYKFAAYFGNGEAVAGSNIAGAWVYYAASLGQSLTVPLSSSVTKMVIMIAKEDGTDFTNETWQDCLKEQVI